ncbi:hypothetical protein [Kitasatospora sp. NBC_01266]|uniref:hypothetical protein n=1 Tax=Kitasatospora sp. NBC_01266 TaxID=2903572 RepID=UPI002E335F8C|nr:hypothetical protein [Kitasatospora sp. NBC_01266]
MPHIIEGPLHVGIRLIAEVMDHAPATLTHREAWVLGVLAEDANDATRVCWPGVEDDPSTVRRMRIPSRSSRYDVLKALRAKGALEVVEAGRRGRRAVYRIPVLATAASTPKGPGSPDANPGLGPDLQDPNDAIGSGSPGPNEGFASGEPGPNEARKGPGSPDATHRKGPDLTPKGSGKPGPLPLIPLKRDNSPTQRASPPPPDAAFEAFWTAYPRRVGKGAARTAWTKALARGAEPEHLVAAAARHAAFHAAAGTDPKFIPHPSSWLNAERYDDELHTPQPAGPQQPAHQRWADQGIF